MDNKYGLGSTKVATEHHETVAKSSPKSLACKYCGSYELVLSQTMHDHRCANCGEWQSDVDPGYSTGRSSLY